MIQVSAATAINQLIAQASHILVIQADNPDGDSLGSALALEEFLENLGKQVSLYCGADIPSYLRYVSGWDRVTGDIPNTFDLSIVVDASTKTLLESVERSNQMGKLSSKPCIVIDHHTSVINSIDFAAVSIVDATYASTGDILFHLARQLEWPITKNAAKLIMVSILGDTQGLSNMLASAETYRTMAALIEAGANRVEIEETRRLAGKMPLSILRYKAKLIERAELHLEQTIATVVIPPEEIKKHSPLYNPAPLIQGDLLQTEKVQMAIVFKYYNDGRVTAAIRSSGDYAFADKLAESFGGGGHPYASGFKDTTGKSIDEIKDLCLDRIAQLTNNLSSS